MAKFRILKTGVSEDGIEWSLISKVKDGITQKAFIKTTTKQIEGNDLDIPEHLLSLIKWLNLDNVQRHKIITEVFTRIKKGRQIVGFRVENFPYVIYLTAKQVKQNTNLEIDEVEMLVGSGIRAVFYKKGEELFDGSICYCDNILIKEFWITIVQDIDEFKALNNFKLVDLEIIINVFTFKRINVESVGIKTSNGNVYFVTVKRLSALTKLEASEFHILEKSFVKPEFYHNGEKMANGEICYGENKIIKALNLRLRGNVEEMHEYFENGSNYFYSMQPSYEYYGGPSDGYGGSLDDDFINDVLDGDPEAYWNID